MIRNIIKRLKNIVKITNSVARFCDFDWCNRSDKLEPQIYLSIFLALSYDHFRKLIWKITLLF